VVPSTIDERLDAAAPRQLTDHILSAVFVARDRSRNPSPTQRNPSDVRSEAVVGAHQAS
jgi:hypothetical protein